MLGRIARGPTAGWIAARSRCRSRFRTSRGAALIGLMEGAQWAPRRPSAAQAARPAWARWPAYYALAAADRRIGDLGAKSFIYFQF